MIKYNLHFLVIVFISALNNPDHCYDFVSNNVLDSCGSVNFNLHCIGVTYLSK